MSSVQPRDSSALVLIVERDQDSSLMYAEHLRAHGFRVVRDGDSLAELLVPDVVVYAARSCAEHAYGIRIVKRGQTVPTILISSDERDRTRGSAKEFQSVLIRPVELDILLREVRRAAALSRPRLPLRSSYPEPSKAADRGVTVSRRRR